MNIQLKGSEEKMNSKTCKIKYIHVNSKPNETNVQLKLKLMLVNEQGINFLSESKIAG